MASPEEIEAIGVGYLRLTPEQTWALSFRQFAAAIEGQKKRDDDGWDYTRNIIAGIRGLRPRQVMRLDRDKVKRTKELLKEAEEFLHRMRASMQKDKKDTDGI
jgi:hypothetical protein